MTHSTCTLVTLFKQMGQMGYYGLYCPLLVRSVVGTITRSFDATLLVLDVTTFTVNNEIA